MTTMADALASIEAARRAGRINNDAARAASVALGLTGDDAMLACRLLAQGADPASIEYLAWGKVSEPIALAHRQGPGSLTGVDRDTWLYLAALSADESQPSTLRERVLGLIRAYCMVTEDDSSEGVEAKIAAKRAEIAALPYKLANVGGREMRVYRSNLGFASAYWAGEPCAAVLSGDGDGTYIAVGSNGVPLADLEVTVGKPLAPCFGIIEDREMVGMALATWGDA
jgi:hypothetical protein